MHNALLSVVPLEGLARRFGLKGIGWKHVNVARFPMPNVVKTEKRSHETISLYLTKMNQ